MGEQGLGGPQGVGVQLPRASGQPWGLLQPTPYSDSISRAPVLDAALAPALPSGSLGNERGEVGGRCVPSSRCPSACSRTAPSPLRAPRQLILLILSVPSSSVMAPQENDKTSKGGTS